MFCKNCGIQLPDDASFCPACGASVKAEEPAVFETVPQAEPVVEPVATPAAEPVAAPVVEAQPQPQAQPAENTTVLMVLAIIGLALGVSFWPAVGGIVVSAIAKNKIEAFVSAGGQLTGKAKVANILSKIGLPVSIAMSVLLTIYIIVIAVSGAAEVLSVF